MSFSKERDLTPFYELLDFGNGRKLEWMAGRLLDRPCPAAEGLRKSKIGRWSQADLRYHRQSAQTGTWTVTSKAEVSSVMDAGWTLDCGMFRLRLQPTPAGQVGVFAEQLENWRWIVQQVQRAGRPLQVLNLFGYTGASTLAAAAAGAAVTHVDAADNIVQWARENAELSGLADAPVRWIVEDAMKFVQRELRRSRQYDAIILDPPSYGHGPKGEVFRLSEHLLPLLEHCGKLTAARRAFMLLTCHTPGYGPAELEACLCDAVFGACSAGVHAERLWLKAADGRKLSAGVCARWP